MPAKEPRFHGEVTEKSHKNMSRIHGKDTRIEIVLRKALWSSGVEVFVIEKIIRNCQEGQTLS